MKVSQQILKCALGKMLGFDKKRTLHITPNYSINFGPENFEFEEKGGIIIPLSAIDHPAREFKIFSSQNPPPLFYYTETLKVGHE